MNQAVYANGRRVGSFPARRLFLYNENHSQGEWFQRRLKSILQKEELPLL